MNAVVISGKVKADAKLVIKPGFEIAMFQVENTIGFGDKKKTQILNVKKFGKKVAGVAKYLVAGRQVEVTGKLVVETFQQGGVTKEVTLIAATEIELGYLPKPQGAAPAGTDDGFDNTAEAEAPEPDDNQFFGA